MAGEDKPFSIVLVLNKFRNAEVVTIEDRYGEKKRAVCIPLADNDLHETMSGNVNIQIVAIPVKEVDFRNQQTHFLKQIFSKDFFEQVIRAEKYKSPIIGNVTKWCGNLKYERESEEHRLDFYTYYSNRFHLSANKKVIHNAIARSNAYLKKKKKL